MKIVRYPHPALRFKAQPVATIDNQLCRIVGDMLELMYSHKGLGLAAPQVAVPIQLFVMNPTGDPEQKDKDRVYINPVILERKGGMVEAEEGCLSFPDLYQNVRRPRTVRVQAYDQHGKSFEHEINDLEARIVQHETDHLHGILFIDKFGPIAKLSSRTPLSKFEREYKKAQEKNEIAPDKELLRQLKEWPPTV